MNNSDGSTFRDLNGGLEGRMYNLNVPSTGGDGMVALPQSGSQTPRTPEVLNTLMAVMNPLDAYTPTDPKLASSPPGDSDMGSGTGSGISPTPPAHPIPVSSIQKTRSLLIKEGLKLTIQAKRGAMTPGSDSAPEPFHEKPTPFLREEFTMDSLGSDDGDDGMSSIAGDAVLSLEDEERRRRRREKNKIAATKCRLKKRARTVKLEEESKLLENQNVDLKAEIEKLKSERQQLVEMLSGHQKHCKKNHRITTLTEDDFANDPEFISTDLGTNPFQAGDATLTTTPLEPSKPEAVGQGPSTSLHAQYPMDYPAQGFPPPETVPVRQDYVYPGSEVYFSNPDIKPPIGIIPGGAYYERSYETPNSSFPPYRVPAHQSPFAHSEYDSNVEMMSPASTATSSYTDYSNSDASTFSHFPVPCATSPAEEYAQSHPRYNCVYEINP